jgi:D-alanine-D-alanine ligase
VVESEPRRLGRAAKRPDAVAWLSEKLTQLDKLSDRRARVAVAATDLRSYSHPVMLPHRMTCTLMVSYPTPDAARGLERKIRDILGKQGCRWELALLASRPPMPERAANVKLARQLSELAGPWDIEIASDTSQVPSAAGLVPSDIPVLCGLGPITEEPFTPQERVMRFSLVQRTLLLTLFLAACAREET